LCARLPAQKRCIRENIRNIPHGRFSLRNLGYSTCADLSQSITCRRLTGLKPTKIMFPTLARWAASASVPTSSPALASRITEVRYPYFVARQPTSGRLPVYNEFRAGTKATTLIRNIDGNAGVRRILQTTIQFSQSSCVLNSLGSARGSPSFALPGDETKTKSSRPTRQACRDTGYMAQCGC
jgi:hypothetical protein